MPLDCQPIASVPLSGKVGCDGAFDDLNKELTSRYPTAAAVVGGAAQGDCATSSVIYVEALSSMVEASQGGAKETAHALSHWPSVLTRSADGEAEVGGRRPLLGGWL